MTIAQPRTRDTAERARFPRVRFGRRWVNLWWIVAAAVILIGLGIIAAVLLRQLPAVQSFIADHPGTTPRAADQEFPWWLRWQHFFNILFLIPIVRAGLQILAGRPRLYWHRPAQPGREWLRINSPVDPATFSARNDPVGLPSNIGLPGTRRSHPIARWWHLAVDVFWLANGIVFYVLLFATGQWVRIVPTSWDVFPDAASTALQYLSLDFPVENTWVAYNGLQLLTYFITVFIAAPLAIITGILQSPSLSKKLHAATSRFANVEVARSAHVIVLGWFIVFTIAHVALVLSTGWLVNLNHITTGTNDAGPAGAIIAGIGVAVLLTVWLVLSPYTKRHPDRVQKTAVKILGPLNKHF